jgi:aspartyl-tRNA(Asn)/glutamyl-tRNA(Gln) amidotransferase subunit B
MEFKPVIGLEIHIELDTASKMFCSCPNRDESHPNVSICPICTAQPGSLPVINEEAIRKTIKTGLALNCQISENPKFDRKSYFYPDLPKGYQISQFYIPFCKDGFLEMDDKKIKIREVHLEEDTGKLVHPESEDCSLVDFNRAGVPLMELVTEPDMGSAKEARQFAEELRLILRYLNVSKADMEKGQLRVEANISVGKSKKLGTKVEIKNLNSFKAVERGIDYEIKRQTESLKSGKKIIQETRGWDKSRGVTVSQRWKEEAQDYRYFPEPDLPPLKITKEYIQKVKADIPELPQQKRERLEKEYGLSTKEIEVFVQNKDLGEYFEKVMSELRNWVKVAEVKSKVSQSEFNRLIKLGANYILTDLQAMLKKAAVVGENFLINAENFAEFVTLIYQGKISSKIGKIVLAEMFKTGADPSQIIKEKGLAQIEDGGKIDKLAQEVINKNPKPVEDYYKGKEAVLQFLVGQLMKESKGRVNPQMANDILRKLLKR